jgi:Uma2 family endonuclease
VICGPVTLDEEDEAGETVTNPTVIVEVLSDSTERYDRGTKFDHYQSIPSLKQYVLVSQNQARVEAFLRQGEGTWQYVSFTGMEAVATLAALAIPLPLAEVFAGVEFPASPPLRLLPKA